MKFEELERRKHEHRAEIEAIFADTGTGVEEKANLMARLIGVPTVDETIADVRRLGEAGIKFLDDEAAIFEETFDSVEFMLAFANFASLVTEHDVGVRIPPLSPGAAMTIASILIQRWESTKNLRNLYGEALNGDNSAQ